MDNGITPSQTRSACASGLKTGGILHVHPLLRCNLACMHCYSDSSPRRHESVRVEDIIALMPIVKEMGFDVISVSGGEPFLYPPLASLLRSAKEMGMRTQLVTNGTLLETPIARESLPYLDLVAISIDGDEALHDAVRKHKGAYKKAIQGARSVVDKNIRLGIIHAITSGSWKKMIEVAELSFELGSSLIQFHPLELSGRAITELPEGLSLEDLHRAYIVFNNLQEKYADTMHVQMDCLHRLIVQADPEMCGYQGDEFVPTSESFLKLTQSIIVNEKGDVMPFSYGMHSDYFIGNITNKNPGAITEMFQSYFPGKAMGFSKLLSDSYNSYQNTGYDDDLVVWSEFIVRQSKMNCMPRIYRQAQ